MELSVYAFSILVFCLQFLQQSQAGRNDDLKCPVCLAICNEISLSIKGQDPKKKVKVGNWRVDGKGNQPHTREIPYARSEEFIGDLMDKVCTDKMYQWGIAEHKAKKKRAVIRKYNMDGLSVSTDNLEMHPDPAPVLKSVCGDFLEDHEEEAIEMFTKEGVGKEEAETQLCIEQLGLCTEEDKKFNSEVQSQGIRDAIMKKANEGGDDPLKVALGDSATPEEKEQFGEDDDDDDDIDFDDSAGSDESADKDADSADKNKEEL